MNTQEAIEILKKLEAKSTVSPWFDATNKIGSCGRGIAEVDFDLSEDRKLAIVARNLLPALIDVAEAANRVLPFLEMRRLDPQFISSALVALTTAIEQEVK